MEKLCSTLDELRKEFENFVATLPANTASIQMALGAYDASYEAYDEKKTKCVAEADLWFNLNGEMRATLLQSNVTAALKASEEFNKIPEPDAEDGEDPLVQAFIEMQNALARQYRALARNCAIYLDDINTAAQVEGEVELFLQGVIELKNRSLYTAASEAFIQRKKMPALAALTESIIWKIMTTKQAAKPAAKSAPAAKQASTKQASTKQEAAKEATVNQPIKA